LITPTGPVIRKLVIPEILKKFRCEPVEGKKTAIALIRTAQSAKPHTQISASDFVVNKLNIFVLIIESTS
jgi:hypothetical protein